MPIELVFRRYLYGSTFKMLGYRPTKTDSSEIGAHASRNASYGPFQFLIVVQVPCGDYNYSPIPHAVFIYHYYYSDT